METKLNGEHGAWRRTCWEDNGDEKKKFEIVAGDNEENKWKE